MGGIALTVAVVFAFVAGANDGGTLLALGTRHPDVEFGKVVIILAAAMMIGPAIGGLAVAAAFTDGLADLSGPGGQAVFLAGVVVAMGVALGLTMWGRPTSLTLALVGAVTGAAAGAGLTVSLRTLLTILVVGVLAPAAGAALGYLLGRAARHVPAARSMSRGVRRAHVAAFAVQCVAYAVNDGQKMLAVSMIALYAVHLTPVAAGPAGLPWWALAVTVSVFLAGALASVRRLAVTVSRRLVPLRPTVTVASELAASAAVLGSAGMGTPVSMTQSLSAGIVGAGASQAWRRVRWRAAAQILGSWVLTLPVSLTLGAIAGLGMGMVS